LNVVLPSRYTNLEPSRWKAREPDATAALPPSALLQRIFATVTDFCHHADQSDDVTDHHSFLPVKNGVIRGPRQV
jgi:hypothetical protein